MNKISVMLSKFQRGVNPLSPAPVPIDIYNAMHMHSIDWERIPLDQKAFTACLHASETYSQGSPGRQGYIDGSIPRLYRFFSNLLMSKQEFKGPTLDVASGWGIMYPAFKKYLGDVLPYYIAEITDWHIAIDGDTIDGCKFECEKDRLQFADGTFGLVSFIDCLEHLIVDPVWPLLEFNRVLKLGGHLVMNTPNAAASFRILSILRGDNPATVSQIKPAGIYERHNREWTPTELRDLLECCGFGDFFYATNHQFLSTREIEFIEYARSKDLVSQPLYNFGPELFMVAQKVKHLSLDMDLPEAQRWPEWLYTPYEMYHRRPYEFPVIGTGI